MRIAWFRPASRATAAEDHLVDVLTSLAAAHDLHIIDRAGAHDFVWRQARAPYDRCVFELDDTAGHDFIWPYLLHYPGILALRTRSLHASRTTALMHAHRRRDYDAEMTFSEGRRRALVPWHVARGRWPFLRVPMLASRATVVGDAAWAGELRAEYPQTRVEYAPIGVAGLSRRAGPDSSSPTRPAPNFSPRTAPLRVDVADGQAVAAVERAIDRARATGARIERVGRGELAGRDDEADAIVALGRDGGRPVAAALRGMAAGLPTVVSECGATAGWPAIEPQSWQPRGVDASTPPAVISIDPRDEEHSLMLALRRLAADPVFRGVIGAGGAAWWGTHHTPAHAVAAWESILAGAATIPPPPLPADWPAHLTDDGTGLARQILEEFGLGGAWMTGADAAAGTGIRVAGQPDCP